jgi:hypothetical protein
MALDNLGSSVGFVRQRVAKKKILQYEPNVTISFKLPDGLTGLFESRQNPFPIPFVRVFSELMFLVDVADRHSWNETISVKCE